MQIRFLFTALAVALLTVGCRVPRYQLTQPVVADAGVHEAAFRHTLEGALRTSFVPGNHIVPQNNGDEFVPAMLNAIRAATNSVNLETFIWRSGRMSDLFMEALIERAQAGVEVRVIADALGILSLDREDIEMMRAAGVRFVRFNPPRLTRLHLINFRDHRKLLIVDGRIGFTGGFCIADEWLGNAERAGIWRETNVQVEGPVVAQLQASFAANWLKSQGETLAGEKFYPLLETRGTMLAQNFISGPHDGGQTAHLVYLTAIAAARERILFAQSYFLPDELSIEALRAARRRGVDVQVVSSGDVGFNLVRRASKVVWARLMRDGVQFFEYGPATMHSKVLIVDDLFVSVGSVNVDDRSFRINDESNLNVLDAEFNARMVADFERDRAQARLATPETLRAEPWYFRIYARVILWFRPQL